VHKILATFGCSSEGSFQDQNISSTEATIPVKTVPDPAKRYLKNAFSFSSKKNP
jgi:hypothetical protein